MTQQKPSLRHLESEYNAAVANGLLTRARRIERQINARSRACVIDEQPIDTELLAVVSEAVLLSAAHLDLFQREPSHQKLRAIVGNISSYHLHKIKEVARR